MDVRAVPRFRIGALMELIAVLAVGAACARSQHALLTERGRILPLGPSGVVRAVIGAGLVGAALAGGVALAFERGRRGAAGAWGVGRWIWGVSALVVALTALKRGLALLVFRTFTSRTVPFGAAELIDVLVGEVPGALLDGYPPAVAALCAVAFVTRGMPDPKPDAREWSGRALASVVVGVGFAVPLMRALGM